MVIIRVIIINVGYYQKPTKLKIVYGFLFSMELTISPLGVHQQIKQRMEYSILMVHSLQMGGKISVIGN